MNSFALTTLVVLALPVLAGGIFIVAVINHRWQHRDRERDLRSDCGEDQP